MKYLLHFLGILLFLSSCSISLPEEVAVEFNKINREVDFNFDVQPILSDRCYACHGPDAKTRKAGLRLDDEKIAFSKLSSGSKAFVSGSLYRSEAAHRILSDDPEKIMPTPDSKLSLSPREKAIILKWIEQGAEWKSHWAFLAPEKTAPSRTAQAQYPNEVDQFVYDKFQNLGLYFEPEADKEALIRRLTFDLTGLPPSLDQINQFLNDSLPGNYERLVDQLMGTTAFAERLTLDWLDLARYADSHGLHADGLRTMWPWRDWVIKAFEKNMPYDQFVTWQLAGDLLPNASTDQKLATAFNRNSPMTAEGGVIDEEWRLHYVFDRTETFSTAFLGLTVACAKCHDHKFDPISQKDYYQLSGFFNNIRELGMTGDDGDYGPLLYLPTKNQQAQLKKLDAIVEKTKVQLSLTEKELTEMYDYIEQLPTAKKIDKGLIGYYPFDKIKPVRTAYSKSGKPEYFIADNNTNTKSSQSPKLVEGIRGKAFEFQSDFDRISITKEIPDFEWTDPFSISLWAQTKQKKKNARQFFLGTTGGKNNWWRGWDFYLDDENHINLRLINMAPGNMIHIRSKDSISVNQWTHLAFTYDGTGASEGIELYQNGAPLLFETLINKLSKSIKPVSASGLKLEKRPVLIGKTYEGSTGDNGLFMGKMDEIKIYGKQLTGFEVNLLFSQYSDRENEVDQSLIQKHWIKSHPKYTAIKKDLRQQLNQWREVMEPVLEVMVMEEMSQARTTYLYNRGNYNEPTETVEPKAPEVLPQMSADIPKNRLGLAQWLFQKDHPLTARVAVNRYWQLLMGNGLVTTPTDFGVQGALPSHPELLDWLALYFSENDWNIRSLIKKIVTSHTYKQKSLFGDEKNKIDPNNTFLARGSSYRLPAEMIRNNALAVSGLLSEKVGGPSVKPYQPEGLWKEKNTFSLRLLEYKESEGEDLYRRGMYTFIKRGSPPPTLITFDATSREICTIKRENTSSPLQSLILLNDKQFVEASRVFAQRILSNQSQNLQEQIKFGFRLATSRWPKESELMTLIDLYDRQLNFYATHKSSAAQIVQVGASQTKSTSEIPKIAAMTLVANTLLNLNESYFKY